MVLAYQIGKVRPFSRTLLLYIASLGIYGIYWHFKAHDEVHKQFELQRQGRDGGLVWFLLGLLVFQPLMWVYLWLFLSNVQRVKQSMRLQSRVSPGGFLGLTIPGGILLSAGTLGLTYGVIFSILVPIIDADPAATEEDQAFADDIRPLLNLFWLIGAPAFVAGTTLSIIAYARLQEDLNDIWRVYQAKMYRPTNPATSPGLPHQPRGQGPY